MLCEGQGCVLLGCSAEPRLEDPRGGESPHGGSRRGITSTEASGSSPGPLAEPHFWLLGEIFVSLSSTPWAALPGVGAMFPALSPSSSVSLLLSVPRTIESPRPQILPWSSQRAGKSFG